MAECLHLSRRAVENKLRSIYEKMGVHNQGGFKKSIKDRGLNDFIPTQLSASSIELIN